MTGPDEYTTVVNDNLYTNVMARFNMRYAARVVESLREWDRDALRRACAAASGSTRRRSSAGSGPPTRCTCPYDEALGINPQDDTFLELEPWDFANTPPDKYPLLLHFHPLVIYRHQVLKQADVVLAMVLRSDQFPLDQKRRNFDYYDPITTGDSSLSACVQAMAAAQIGYDELAVDYFREALFVDLADTHGNASDGVHVASCGGVVGHDRVRVRRPVRRRHRAALHAEPAVAVGGHHVPHATPRLAAARRDRRRRRARSRSSTATPCPIEDGRTAPRRRTSTSASATGSPSAGCADAGRPRCRTAARPAEDRASDPKVATATPNTPWG